MEKEFIEVFVLLPKWSLATIGFLLSSVVGIVIYAVRVYFAASREFHDTICSEFKGLYPTPSQWPADEIQIIKILKEKYPRLEIAVHKFRAYLPCFIRTRFDKAWLEYVGEKDGYQSYWQYVPYHDTSVNYDGTVTKYDNTKTYQNNFTRNVKNLLKYARRL